MQNPTVYTPHFSSKCTNKALSGTDYHITFSVLNLSQAYSFLTDETIQTPKMVVSNRPPNQVPKITTPTYKNRSDK